MKKIIIIISVIVLLVGACTATLFSNKKKIDEKSRLDAQIRNIPVFVTELRKKNIVADFSSNGSFFAIHELTLMSETQGRVVALQFNTGDFVKQGQLLVKLDDELMRSRLSLAEANYEKSKADYLKFQGLLKADAVSSQQLEEARIAMKAAETEVTGFRKQVEYASIKAPIQGSIVKRQVEIGSVIMPGSVLAEIVDISRLKFIADVPEYEAVKVRKGMTIAITSSMFPGTVYKGKVQSISVKADESRRFAVEIEVPNDAENSLKAGMYGTAAFSTGGTHEALCVPRHCIVGSIRSPKVYVVEKDVAVLKEIRIGMTSGNDVEVLEGLFEGDRVVTSGQINLDNNTPVSIVNKENI